MKTADAMLSDFVEIGRRFLRSVNLEKDFSAGAQNGEYIITPTARRILRQVAEGLEKDSPYRAWTVTGPYGVGKSAFGVFLTRLLCSREHAGTTALNQLREMDPACCTSFSQLRSRRKPSQLLFPVLVTARRVSAGVCLLDGLISAAGQLRGQAIARVVTQAESLLKAAQKTGNADSREVVVCFGNLATALERQGYTGLLIILDELGKPFEYAAHKPNRGDVFVLQELAEFASRSGTFPILLVGFLHQSFEEYGRHLDSTSRNEWAKIQGRFQDVAFIEPPEQVLRMIAAAIRWAPGSMPTQVTRRIKNLADEAIKARICPPGMRQTEFVETCLRSYPLHPAALVALPYLFHRFAQNERSLFSYLSSHEPKGFQDFLQSHPLKGDSPSFIRLPDLFDYFTANFGAGLFRQPHARRWLEAADTLDRRDGLSELQANLVKAIGILSSLGTFSHLNATRNMIAVGVADSVGSKDVENGLQSLTEKSVLTYRKFNETYRTWEGSDVDIEERIREGERRTRADLRLGTAIQRYLPPRPVVARRHSFETGALRHFDVRYVDAPEDIMACSAASPGSGGSILVCLSASNAQLTQFKTAAIEATHSNTAIIVAIPEEVGELRSTVAELASLRWAWDNTPELRDDRVARREFAARIADAQQLLLKSLSRLLDPRPEPEGSHCLWYHEGEKQKAHRPVNVAQLLSSVCDRLYAQSPRVRNELISRRILSSAAAAARRSLVERMLMHADKENLGLEGYPPERSMYESVLKATGLHRRSQDGSWRLAEPPKSSPCNLWPAWQRLHEIIFKAQPSPEPVPTVFRALAEAPYGVPDGLLPVLLCAFLRCYAHETTLYREGSFVAEAEITDFEVLMRRPELFAVAGCRVTGGRAAVVERIANGLRTEATTVHVVRQLFRLVKGLPEFARSTMKLSEHTLTMRRAFANAKSPELFLFIELPEALGVEGFGERKPSHTHIDGFFEALNRSLREWAGVTPTMIEGARRTLLTECGVDTGPAGWNRLRDLASSLEVGLTDPVLLPFVRRAAQASMDGTGAESVLAVVANRPPQLWTDNDVQRFPDAARAIGEAFRHAVAGRTSPMASSGLSLLSPEDRGRAEALADALARWLHKQPAATSPEVARAAMSILARTLQAQKQEK